MQEAADRGDAFTSMFFSLSVPLCTNQQTVVFFKKTCPLKTNVPHLPICKKITGAPSALIYPRHLSRVGPIRGGLPRPLSSVRVVPWLRVRCGKKPPAQKQRQGRPPQTVRPAPTGSARPPTCVPGPPLRNRRGEGRSASRKPRAS